MATDQSASRFFSEWTLKECRGASTKKVPAPHQSSALARLGDWYGGAAEGSKGGILVLPTGAGKTFTAVHFLCNGPLSDGYKVLWLAHTHHLLEQAFGAFTAGALRDIREPRSSLRLRVVSGTPGHFPPRDIKPSDDVVLATLQTVTNAHREKLSQLRAFIESAAGKLFVVFDEAHHSPAPSYRRLLLDLREDGAQALGLTATPTYSDESKQGWLKKLFPQGILAQARASDLIASGILARPNFERADTKVVPSFDESAYQKWLGTYRDIPEDVVDHLAKNAERNGLIAETYAQNRAKYGKTIIFTDRWYQCESIVEALTKRGVKAAAVYSHVDTRLASMEARKQRNRDENAKVLEAFKNNELDVLVNVRMLTEGTDLPDAQSVFLTRQTTSNILLTQMVGRALRGPKFGGTANAYVVSFIDEWQQAIRWAEYDPLSEGAADDAVRVSSKRPPLQLISIDLVKRLARQMDTGVNVTPGPFKSLMPVGWYHVTYDVLVAGDVEPTDQLVMVFDDEKAGFDKLIASLLKNAPEALGEEAASFDAQHNVLDALRTEHLSGVARSEADLRLDIFHVARHVAQGHGMPEFFPFEIRGKHDLDAIAEEFISLDLGPKALHERLRIEFERKDRFWRVLFPRFEQFRFFYEGCQARILAGPMAAQSVAPAQNEAPSSSETDEEVKEQVKRRDGYRCLACGATKHLQADHVVAVYNGGPNHIDNLQTLCKVCNLQKRKRTIWFTRRYTELRKPPAALEHFDDPDDAGDRGHWERFLRRTINFSLECGAVSEVVIGGRGETYYNWSIELMRGNSPALLEPHLEGILERIQAARADAGKPAIESISITSPGEKKITFPRG
jgi:superfamily II DNA or RNA helicase